MPSYASVYHVCTVSMEARRGYHLLGLESDLGWYWESKFLFPEEQPAVSVLKSLPPPGSLRWPFSLKGTLPRSCVVICPKLRLSSAQLFSGLRSVLPIELAVPQSRLAASVTVVPSAPRT